MHWASGGKSKTAQHMTAHYKRHIEQGYGRFIRARKAEKLVVLVSIITFAILAPMIIHKLFG